MRLQKAHAPVPSMGTRAMDVLLVHSTADPYIIMKRHCERSCVALVTGVHGLQLVVIWMSRSSLYWPEQPVLSILAWSLVVARMTIM